MLNAACLNSSVPADKASVSGEFDPRPPSVKLLAIQRDEVRMFFYGAASGCEYEAGRR